MWRRRHGVGLASEARYSNKATPKEGVHQNSSILSKGKEWSPETLQLPGSVKMKGTNTPVKAGRVKPGET